MEAVKNTTAESARPAAVAAPLLLALFALHTFLLMGVGTWSDLAMSGEDFGSALYYTREGVLAAGFLLYAAFAQWRKSRPLSPKAADIADIVLVVLFAACIVVLQVSSAPSPRVAAVLVIALIVGVSGGLVYERIALAAFQISCAHGKTHADGKARTQEKPRMRSGDATRILGPVVGGGGELAVALQYALQTGFSLGVWLNVCFVVCFCLIIWLARKMRRPSQDAQSAEAVSSGNAGSSRNPRSLGAAPLACMIIVAICLVALLSFYEAAMRASGAVASFYEWHRLFMVAGYAIIGAAAYLGGRSAASVAVLVSALFAIIVSVQTAMLEAGPLTAVLFYILAAATLAWIVIMFMSVAAQSRCPALVASLGRILIALVTLSGSLIQVAGEPPMMTVLVGSLILLAAAVIAMAKGGFLELAARTAEDPASSENEPAPSPEENVLQLARECSLTDREQEVLAALVLTEEKNQQIADDLGISRRQLQTHVSRIYKKTGATTRAGLVMRVNGES